MPAPIRAAWWNRLGWSEYLAPRYGGNKHWGYDSYCEPLTNVYAIGTGIVRGIDYAGAGFGHFITVWYPEIGITQREAHLNERPDYVRVGQTINTQTRIGRVGNTGNAKGIFWPAATSPNGKLLWHVHSQAWKGDNTRPENNVNPTLYWGGSAGGGGTPIEPPKEIEMATNWVDTSTYVNGAAVAGTRCMTTWEGGPKLEYERTRKSGEMATIMFELYGPHKQVNHEQFEAIRTAFTPQATGGGEVVDLSPVLNAIAEVPTATENGQAARSAIVK